MGHSWIAMKVLTTHDRIELVANAVCDCSKQLGVQVILTAKHNPQNFRLAPGIPFEILMENFLKVKKGIHGIIWKRGRVGMSFDQSKFFGGSIFFVLIKRFFRGVLH